MKKYYFLFGEGSKINQIICAVLINIPVFEYGSCIGWMSPMTLLLQSKDSPRETPLTDHEVSWIAAAAFLACILMNYLIAFVGDKIGRKLCIIFVSASCAAVWIIKLSFFDTWALVLARSLVGISMAGSYVTCPVYTKEISDDSIRGALGSLVVVFHTTGNLFLYIIGDVLNYNTVLWICLAIPVVHVVLFMMMPESPSYLMKHGNREEAARVIAWLRCRDIEHREVQQELDLIKKEQSNDMESSRFVYKAILKDKILLRAFGIAMMVVIAREFCGAVPVQNFAGHIFALASKETKLVLTPNQQAMLLGAVQVVGSLVASSVVEKAGRKPLLFLTSLVSGLSMCTLASWFLAREYGVFAPEWLPIVTLCFCIFCDSAGLLPISVVIVGEIFSFKYRSAVFATCMATSTFLDFLELLFFKPIASSVGVHVAFYFFGIMCLINAIYIIIVIPETKKRSLEEIYADLKTKKEKMKEELKL